MKILKFKKELGWSEVIAACALFISIFALWQSNQANKAHVVIGTGYTGVGAILRPENNDCVLVSSLSVEINNSGAKSTIINRIRQAKGIPVIRFSKESKVLRPDEIKYEIFLLQHPLRDQHDCQYAVTNKFRTPYLQETALTPFIFRYPFWLRAHIAISYQFLGK